MPVYILSCGYTAMNAKTIIDMTEISVAPIMKNLVFRG